MEWERREDLEGGGRGGKERKGMTSGGRAGVKNEGEECHGCWVIV